MHHLFCLLWHCSEFVWTHFGSPSFFRPCLRANMLVYCLSKHLRPCLHVSARICARVRVCLQRLIYQNKCLWLPADGWPLGASLESPVTSCGGDRGRGGGGGELTTYAGKTLAGWISVFSFNPFVHGKVLLSTLALFQHRPTSYSCTCTQSHLAAAQCSHCLLLYFISLSCSTGANKMSALLKGTLPVSVERRQSVYTFTLLAQNFPAGLRNLKLQPSGHKPFL